MPFWTEKTVNSYKYKNSIILDIEIHFTEKLGDRKKAL